MGYNIAEKSQEKNNEIKQKALNRAIQEVEGKVRGDLSQFSGIIEKMDNFYNKPIQLIKNQDDIYLRIGEAV